MHTRLLSPRRTTMLILVLVALALLLNVGGDLVLDKGSWARETSGFVSVLLLGPIAALIGLQGARGVRARRTAR